MLKRIVLLGLLAIAAPAFGIETDVVTGEPEAAPVETEAADAAVLDTEAAATDSPFVAPEADALVQIAGANCGYSAPDCPRSTGGCGGRPFWSSCNGGAGVCVEACDSWQTGQTMCECWSSSFAGAGGMQVADMLMAPEPPPCKRSSDSATASK